MALFCAILIMAALLYAGGDFLQLDMARWADASRTQRFVGSTVMILLTMGLLPLALRLFKIPAVSADLLARQAPALARWGTVRLLVLGLLLLVNEFLYYAFAFESTYGYLAVVVLLCMPFVVPTMGRCQAEVTPEEEPEKEESDEEANGSDSQL